MKERIIKIGRVLLDIILFVSALAFSSQIITWGTKLMNQSSNLLMFLGVLVCIVGVFGVVLTINEGVKEVLKLFPTNKEENN
jgi:uncharacterized membrane protein YcjF (UPF0283 family)